MSSFFDELRARPHEERTAIAASAAASVGFIVLLLWAFTFFRNETNTKIVNAPATAIKGFNSVYEDARAEFEKVGKDIEEIKKTMDQANVISSEKRDELPMVRLFVDEDGETQVETVSK